MKRIGRAVIPFVPRILFWWCWDPTTPTHKLSTLCLKDEEEEESYTSWSEKGDKKKKFTLVTCQNQQDVVVL
jgi:hypothetical protein